MATQPKKFQPKKLKKNIEGFRDHFGIFHPIRSGNKEQGRLYDAGAAGDYDFPAEREERRERNQQKADQIYQERLLREALDGALGEERKFSLAQFVRSAGGLKYDPTGKTTKGKKDSWYGELAAFSFKETGKKGLAHKGGKYGVDGMREQANEAGYPNMETESDFLDALEKDLRTGDVYPFFSADYMTNPTTPAAVYRGKAREIGKAAQFFKKRGKTAKANKLEKARTIALNLAKKAEQEEKTLKTSSKTKKRTSAKSAKKTAAKQNPTRTASVEITLKNGKKQYDFVVLRDGQTLAAKRKELKLLVEKAKTNPKLYQDYKDWKSFTLLLENPAINTTAKKPANNGRKTVAKKSTPIKNGLIETAAALAVGASAAVGLYDRATKGAKVSKKPNREMALQHNKSNAADIVHHEKEFDRLLGLIERGETAKIRSAKLQGKLAGYSQREVEHLTERARLHHSLKINPAKVDLAAAQKLVHNGRFKQFLERKKAVHHFNRQLRLEQQLDRTKTKRAKAESAAKKRNPAKKLKFFTVDLATVFGSSKRVWVKAADRIGAMKEAEQQNKGCRWTQIREGKIGYKENPAKPAKLVPNRSQSFYEFQGRETTKTLEVPRPEAAPRHTYCLGVLFELRLKGHKNLNFRRESSHKTFYVAADEKNKQLWILGGSIHRADNTIKKGLSVPIAEITHIVYSTHKAHLDDVKNQGYIHEFGEMGGKRPTLARDRNGFPIIQGGDYTITPLGIEN